MIISDAHNDYFTSKAYSNAEALPKNALVNYAVWGTELDEREIFERAREIKDRDLILSFEDVSNVCDIEKILALKPIWCSLTWNYDNNLGGGCYGKDTGLTRAGKLWCKILKGQGICIDTAHASQKTFFDVTKISDCVVNSHSCVYALEKNDRNLRDEQIKLIYESKGFFGLCFHSPFLSGRNISSSEDVIKHIDYVAEKFGISCLGLGTDFYGSNKLPLDLNSYKNIENLTERLEKLGYPDQDIKDIIYENFAKFIKSRASFAY